MRETSNQTLKTRQPPERIKLTMARTEGLKTPPGKKLIYVWDTQRAGLGVRVMASGAKSYVWYGKVYGKPRRITLGSCSALSLNGARSKAQAIWDEVANGLDPAEQDRKRKAARYTLGQCLDDWLNYACGRKKTVKEDVALIRLHIHKKLLSRPLSTIGTPDVENLANSIVAKGTSKYPRKRTANKVLALLSSAISRAVTHKLVESNPVKGASRHPVAARERFIKPDEMPRFLAALREQPQPWQGYFMLLLATGARRSAVAAMKWKDIDLSSQVWHLPASDSKTANTQAIPLSRAAIEALESVRPFSQGHIFVFPSASKTGHIVEPRKPWLRLCAAAEIEDLRMHDLRRTLGSWLTAEGAPTALVMKALGHKSLQAAQVYQRLDIGAVRAAVEVVNERMMLGSIS